jgi:hypothetical protein
MRIKILYQDGSGLTRGWHQTARRHSGFSTPKRIVPSSAPAFIAPPFHGPSAFLDNNLC